MTEPMTGQQRIHRAVRDKGIAPHHHDRMLAALARDWPTLYAAVMYTVHEYETQHSLDRPEVITPLTPRKANPSGPFNR